MSTVTTSTYTAAHSVTFLSDRLRVLLKVLIMHYGLDPEQFTDAWHDWVDLAARTWLESCHLRSIVIEFHLSGATQASARWDFPIEYSGSGFEDMWDDRQFFAAHFAKATAPPANCTYRVLLTRSVGAPSIPGISDTAFLSTAGMTVHEAGTVIATPHLTAGARYYRK